MKKKKQIRDTRITNLDEIKNTIELLIEDCKTFTHSFSNYTNQIECEEFRTKWIKEERPKLVFIAYSKLMKELNNSSKAKIINSQEYKTENYSNLDSEEDFELDHVINLDISACYPYTLFIHKLISQETLDYLMKLEKNERLPAIGMIAYQRLNYHYKEGVLQDITHEKGPYQNIFFWIIETVNNLFLDIKELAGPYYIMHWVDGVFLFPDIPLDLLEQIQRTITKWGYRLKEESCRDFKFVKDGKKIDIQFTKGGDPKHYRFEDSNYKDHFNKVIKQLHQINQRSQYLTA